LGFRKYQNVSHIKTHMTKLRKLKKFVFWNRLGSQALQGIAEMTARFQAVLRVTEARRKDSTAEVPEDEEMLEVHPEEQAGRESFRTAAESSYCGRWTNTSRPAK
jgi:hypothetical protein